MRRFMFRIPEGEEFIGYIQDFSRENDVRTAFVSAIGSFKRAKIGYFSIDLGEYVVKPVDSVREVVSAVGNVSLKDGSPFAHVHVVLGDEGGNLVGGHLVEAEVFVAEVYMEEYPETLHREKFGDLYLWREHRRFK